MIMKQMAKKYFAGGIPAGQRCRRLLTERMVNATVIKNFKLVGGNFNEDQIRQSNC